MEDFYLKEMVTTLKRIATSLEKIEQSQNSLASYFRNKNMNEFDGE